MSQVTETFGKLNKSKKHLHSGPTLPKNLERQQSVTWAKSETDSK